MIVTELYKGQGLGNQLACYVTTRAIALDKGYKFGIKNPQNFKGLEFLDIDFGEKVLGGKGPEGGPPTELPEGIKHYYTERKIFHPNGSDISIYDKDLVNVLDDTKIDGLMQGEEYIEHRKEEIKKWLEVKKEYECYEYADENTCVINFRGGEYARHPEFFLEKSYWDNAISHMRKINPNFRFIVITDDTLTAKKFFPDFGVFHFSIGKDYSIIKNAHYLILSNSTFAFFPAWLSDNLKYAIAPKYFARHNISDGYWSLGTNITKSFTYQDKEGKLFTYEECMSEFEEYKKNNRNLYENNIYTEKPLKSNNKSFLKRNTPLWIKNIVKSIINEYKFILNKILQPIDLIKEKNRQKNWLSKQAIQEYRQNIKIYDCFNFFNELELLEIRLNILDPYVDYFIILEATETFTGKPKNLFYQENKERFKKWEHKIIHHVINDTPKNQEDLEKRKLRKDLSEVEKEIINNTLASDNIPNKNETQWLREFYQKEYLKKVLIDLKEDDFCYVSDLDEIWNHDILIDYSKNDIYRYKQIPYIYYLNNRSNEDWTGWTGTIGTKYKNIKDNPLGFIKNKFKKKGTVVKNGGWHFSFQGGTDMIKKKLESYSHQEINTSEVKENLEDKIKGNKDIRGRFIRFWKDEKDLPKYLVENKEKYIKMFKK